MDLDSDDFPVGTLLSRRHALRLLGGGGFAALGARTLVTAQTPGAVPLQCVVRPEMTEGPYFLDRQLARTDIRGQSPSGTPMPGVPLTLAFAVSHVTKGACSPLANAVVDVWQCDALGEYSGVVDPRFGGAAVKETFLRGAQQTDANGAARFATIYPGWYSGRAVHIHFKIRTQASGSAAFEYTSQLFLPESLTDEIHALPPYATKGRRDTLNERDMIYRGGGDPLLPAPTKTAGGYEAAMAIGLDLSDANVGRPDGEGMRGRGPRGPGPGRAGGRPGRGQ